MVKFVHHFLGNSNAHFLPFFKQSEFRFAFQVIANYYFYSNLEMPIKTIFDFNLKMILTDGQRFRNFHLFISVNFY